MTNNIPDIRPGDRVRLTVDNVPAVESTESFTVTKVAGTKVYYAEPGYAFYDLADSFVTAVTVVERAPKPVPQVGDVFRAFNSRQTYIKLDEGTLCLDSSGHTFVFPSNGWGSNGIEYLFRADEEHAALPLPKREIQVGDVVRWIRSDSRSDHQQVHTFTVGSIEEGFAFPISPRRAYRLDRIELVDPEPPTLPVGAVLRHTFERTDHTSSSSLFVVLPEDRYRVIAGDGVIGYEAPVRRLAEPDGTLELLWLPES